ncbi:MAG: hypothetical protein VB078_12380 [Clostridiaceae bacterium]|nr:hypothetical protein [Clostridiaceae bacterium]
MKRISIIFLSGILVLSLFAGCSSQVHKSAGLSVETTGNSVSEKTESKTYCDTVSNDNTAVPVSNNVNNTNDAKVPDNKSTDVSSKQTSVLDSNSTTAPGNTEDRSAKVTDTSNDMKTHTSDDSQGANVQNKNSGAVGGRCIRNQTKDNTTVPSVNYELDVDKDGTISSADYKLSGMSHDDFASKLVSNGNVGTSTEAKQVINGEITVMCGMFNGACKSESNM